MARIRRIDFRIEAGEHPNWPGVTVLVDGEDLIGKTTGFQGFDPDDLFGPATPLLPTDPPRRVAVYRCSCGEAGCGCAACVISERDGIVRWYDFRDIVGVYAGPVLDEDPDGGAEHDLPNLAFDSGQYRRAVERASADRSWETPARRIARLLRARLAADEARFVARGYRLGWVAPASEGDGGFDVELRLPTGQVVVRGRADPDLTDEEAADRLAAGLAGPEVAWDVVHRNEWPAD